MLLIPRKRIWTQQPQYPAQIDWSNPVCRGLFFASNKDSSILEASTIFGVSSGGVSKTKNSIVTNGTNGYVKYVTNTRNITNQTIISVFTVLSAPSVDYAGIALSGFDSDDPNRPTSRICVNKNGTLSALSQTSNGAGITSGASNVIGNRIVACVARTENNFSLYENGILSSSNTIGGDGVDLGGTHCVMIGRGGYSYSYRYANVSVETVLVWDRALSPVEIASISANPWQIFRAPDNRIWIPASAGTPVGAVLAGNAQAQATATGNLTLQASLDAVALAVATASGNLTTFIPLTGAAVAIGAATGSLTTGIKLSAAATASALASGSLVAQIRLNGAALAQAAASAGLTSAILLAGSAQGQATASGTLAADPGSMAANAQAQATVVATLTTSIRLSGAAAAQAGVSGLLTTNISLTAVALAQAIATGTLAVPILLAGAAHGVATATGNLTAPDSPATAVHFRVNSSVKRLTAVACTAQRLTQATAFAKRLTTIKHEVQHV